MKIKEEFDRLIADQGIKDYILGSLGDAPFSDILSLYDIMDRVVNLAFMYAFSCYVDARNRGYAVVDHNANSARVVKTLEKIFTEHPIKNELVQFVLFDIHFDFLLGGESRLKKVMPLCMDCNSAEDFHLDWYFSVINQSRDSSRTAFGNFEETDERLVRLIKFFPFLRDTKLRFDEESGWYVFEVEKNEIFKNGLVYTYGLIHKLREGRRKNFFFNLASVENGAMRYEHLKRSQIWHLSADFADVVPDVLVPEIVVSEQTSSFRYLLPWDAESMYTYLNPALLQDKKGIARSTQIYSINYKYIKHLALAISDALGRDSYVGSDGYIRFLTAFGQRDTSKDIDSVVLTALISHGPSRVLNVLIKEDKSLAYQILKNIKKRLGVALKEKEVPKTGQDFEKEIDAMIEFEQIKGVDNEPVKTEAYKRQKNNLRVEAMTDYILSIISSVNKGFPIRFTGQIGQSAETLKLSETDSVCHTITDTLGIILKRIICFYTGVFAFGKEKRDYDAISEYSLPTKEKIRESQRKCNEAFVAAATEAWSNIKEVRSIKAIVEKLWDLCKRCDDNDPKKFEDRMDLYTVLGKYSIITPELFAKKVEIDKGIADLSENSSPDVIEAWRQKAIAIIRFLTTGVFEKVEGDAPEQPFLKAIVPSMATFYRMENGTDGYNAATFFLTIDATGDRTTDYLYEIMVLSEFEYDMRKKYYCLPNVLRVEQKWWVDPLMIECDLVDNIFKEE